MAKESNKSNTLQSIYEIVTSNYSAFMQIAKREYKKIHTHKILDEEDSYKDIAHDTLLNICRIFDKVPLTLTHAKSYFCKAVQINYYADIRKAEIRNVIDADFNEENLSVAAENNQDATMDYYILINEMKGKFKPEEVDLFIEFMDGEKAEELNKRYNINNAFWVIRKIKRYIDNHYYGYDLKRKKTK